MGTCDASAAVPLKDKKFVVAGDEINVLQIYDWNKPGEGKSIDLSRIVPGVKKKTELDIEGATRAGDITYWISSHSRSKKKGQLKEERQILFALNFRNEKPTLVGKPCKTLLKELVEHELYKTHDLEDFSKRYDSERAAESAKGFNIEGLSTWKDGQILIGLRGPLSGNHSILIPLKNPFEVVNGKKPEFGEMLKLDLGGSGIRGIEYVPALKRYIILVESLNNKNPSSIYLWSGEREDTKPKPVAHPAFEDRFCPETVIAFPDSKSIIILSDDGNQRYNGKMCKNLEKEGKQVFFRACEIKLED